MTIRLLAVLFLLPALFLVFACGDDDDSGLADGPEATEATDDDDGGEGGDDDNGDNGSLSDSRGSGTVVIGDETFDFQVDRCIHDVTDGSIIIAGPSITADGQDVYISVESLSTPYTSANVDVGIGSTSLIDVERGNPHYESSGYTADAEFIPPNVTNPDLVVEVNGEKHVSFTGSFHDTEDVSFSAPGSVEATCR